MKGKSDSEHEEETTEMKEDQGNKDDDQTDWVVVGNATTALEIDNQISAGDNTINATSFTSLLKNQEKQSDSVLDLTLSSLCRILSDPYKNLEELNKKEWTNTNTGKRILRFRCIICRGYIQFDQAVAKYKTNDNPFGVPAIMESDNLKTLLIDYYSNTFQERERESISKLSKDNDSWHIVIFGVRNKQNDDDPNQPKSVLEIIGALTFKVLPTLKLNAIYLMWIVVSSSPAKKKKWNIKKDKQSLVFDDTNGFMYKGLGSTMLLFMQKIGIIIAETRPQLSESRDYDCQQIFVESSLEALPFYRYGMGFFPISKELKSLLPDYFVRQMVNDITLYRLVFTGLISMVRPRNIHEISDLNVSLLRDNLISNLYELPHRRIGQGSRYSFYLSRQSKFSSTDHPSSFFVESTHIGQLQKTLTISSRDLQPPAKTNRATLGQTKVLLSSLLEKTNQSNSFFLQEVPSNDLGLFVLRIILCEFIQYNLLDTNDYQCFHQMINLDRDEFPLHFLTMQGNMYFEKERQLVASLVYFVTKLPTKIPPNQVEDAQLYTKRQEGSNAAWFPKVNMSVTEFEERFMSGNLIDALIKIDTMHSDQSKCSPRELLSMLVDLGRAVCHRDHDTSGRELFCFLSCIFQKNITTIYFTKNRKSKTDSNKLSYTVNCQYHNKIPEENEKYISNIIICIVASTAGVYKDNNPVYYVCLNSKVEKVINDFLNSNVDATSDESTSYANVSTIAKKSSIQKRFNNNLATMLPTPLTESYLLYPHVWFVRLLMVDEAWPCNFIQSYIGLLKAIAFHDVFIEVLSFPLPQPKNDQKLYPHEQAFSDAYKKSNKIAIVVLHEAHYFCVLLVKQTLECQWVDSDSTMSESDSEDLFKKILIHYDLPDSSDNWTVTRSCTFKEKHQHDDSGAIIHYHHDSGAICLYDIEKLLELPGISDIDFQRTSCKQLKVAVLQRYMSLYMDLVLDELPSLDEEKTKIMNKLNVADNTFQNLDPKTLVEDECVCRQCNQKVVKRSNETYAVYMRNCSRFCTYHKSCLSTFSSCEQCNYGGCSFLEYTINISDEENPVSYEEPVSFKCFQTGKEYENIMVLKMFDIFELTDAEPFVGKDMLSLAKIALDPDRTDGIYTQCNYNGLSRYRLLTLRPNSWITDDIIAETGKLLVKNIPEIQFISGYFSAHYDIQAMENGIYYMFVINQDENHWFVAESDGASCVFSCFGYFGSINDAEDCFRKTFEKPLPDRAEFCEGSGFKEYQDLRNCGIIALRRIEARTRYLPKRDNLDLFSAVFDSLGSYNCSRIKYAALLAKFPVEVAPDVPFGHVGRGNEDSPFQFSSPKSRIIETKGTGDRRKPLEFHDSEDQTQRDSSTVGESEYQFVEIESQEPMEFSQAINDQEIPQAINDQENDFRQHAENINEELPLKKPLELAESQNIFKEDNVVTTEKLDCLAIQAGNLLPMKTQHTSSDIDESLFDDDPRLKMVYEQKVLQMQQLINEAEAKLKNQHQQYEEAATKTPEEESAEKRKYQQQEAEEEQKNHQQESKKRKANIVQKTLKTQSVKKRPPADLRRKPSTVPVPLAAKTQAVARKPDSADEASDDDSSASEHSLRNTTNLKNDDESMSEKSKSKKRVTFQKTSKATSSKKLPYISTLPPTSAQYPSTTGKAPKKKFSYQVNKNLKQNSEVKDLLNSTKKMVRLEGSVIDNDENESVLNWQGNYSTHKYGSKHATKEDYSQVYNTWKQTPLVDNVLLEKVPQDLENKLFKKYNERDSANSKQKLIFDWKTISDACINAFDFQKREFDRRVKVKEALLKATKGKKERSDIEDEIKFMKEGHAYALDPYSYSNEAFFAHPLSIVGLQCKHGKLEENYGCRFMGITAAWFESNEDETVYDKVSKSNITRKKLIPIKVPLSSKWVNANFDKAFVESVEAYAKDFIYIKDTEKNLTVEAREQGVQLQSAGHKLYERNFRGRGAGLMIIVQIKLRRSYKQKNIESSEETWLIKSVHQTRFERYYGKSEEDLRYFYSDWLEIECDILSDTASVTILQHLDTEAREARSAFLKENRGQQLIRDWSFETQPYVLDNKGFRIDEMPAYQHGVQQIAAIKYIPFSEEDLQSQNKRTGKSQNNQRTGKYYGMAIEGVRNGVRQYTKEIPLSHEWVLQNFTDKYLDVLKQRGETQPDRYLWVPCGKASKRPFEWAYNPSYPKIMYQQGIRDTCVSSSLASCLHYLGLKDLAKWIENFGIEFEKNHFNDSNNSSFLSGILHEVQRLRKDFNKKYNLRKINPLSFDIFNVDDSKKSFPKVLQLVGSDGGVAHAITICDNLIFDSNLSRAVDLKKEYLEFCMDARYIGILKGYELIPQWVESLANTKRSRKKRKSSK